MSNPIEHTPNAPLNADESVLPEGTDAIEQSLEITASLERYNQWVFDLIRPHIKGDVLEVGCGTGNLSRHFAQITPRLVGVDPVGRFLEEYRKALASLPHAKCFHGYIENLPFPATPDDAFDCVVSCNVLEHIPEDIKTLTMISSHLRPGGTVILYVPAMPFAYGSLDRSLGHCRRYTLKSLRHLMTESGLEWVTGRYNNVLGLAGWWFNSRILQRDQLPVGQAKIFDSLVPVLRTLENIIPPPCGQSVLGVARKRM